MCIQLFKVLFSIQLLSHNLSISVCYRSLKDYLNKLEVEIYIQYINQSEFTLDLIFNCTFKPEPRGLFILYKITLGYTMHPVWYSRLK